MSGLAEEEVQRSSASVWARRAGGALLAVAAVGAIALVVKSLGSGASGPPRQVAKITLVPDTPPPPPPKEDKRPEPPKESPKEVKVEQPKQDPPPQPQQAEAIKMEGAGSDNGIAGVTAGTVQQEYTNQKIGGDGTGGGNRFGWFESALERNVQQALQRNPNLRGKDFRVVINVWLGPDGALSRVDLNSSTGNRDADEQIRLALAEMPPLRDRVPEGLPQPVKLRITSRL